MPDFEGLSPAAWRASIGARSACGVLSERVTGSGSGSAQNARRFPVHTASDVTGHAPRPLAQPRDTRPMTRRPLRQQRRVSVLTVLSRPECEALLARNMVGRIAFADRAHVDIVPISYVFMEGWLYARADGPMRTAIRRNRWVAVEVAEVRDVRRWQSVVVRGACYPVRGTGSPRGDAAAAHGVDLLYAKVPSIAPAGINMAAAAIIYRIHADRVTGLKAAPSRSSRTLLARSFDEGTSADGVQRA